MEDVQAQPPPSVDDLPPPEPSRRASSTERRNANPQTEIPIADHPNPAISMPEQDGKCLNAGEGTSSQSNEDLYPRHFTSCKGWTLEKLLEQGKRFREVPRISATDPELLSTVRDYERTGVPLIIEHLEQSPSWPTDLFTVEWLLQHVGGEDISTRNVHDYTDKPVKWTEFIEQCRYKPPFAVPGENERLYGKDVDCPQDWRRWLSDCKDIPPSVLPDGPNDLLKYLLKSEKVETLMCYLGIGDTFTPCHKDLCASSGHNLMCHTENGGSSFWFMTESSDAPDVAQYFQGRLRQELDWETHVLGVREFADAPFTVYVTEQKLGDLVLVPPRSCHQVVNYGGLTVKTSWSRMTLKGLETALFHELPIYQRVCRPELYRVKYILYRSLLCRTSQLEGAQASIRTTPIQPIRSLVGDYNSPTASTLSIPVPEEQHSHPDISIDVTATDRDRDIAELRCLVELFDYLLRQEFAKDHANFFHIIGNDDAESVFSVSNTSHPDPDPTQPPIRPQSLSRKGKERETNSSCTLACDFCGSDIFQSFFECQACATPADSQDDALLPGHHGDGILICPSCYVEGRTCKCKIMVPVQCRPFEQLLEDRNRAVAVLNQATTEDLHLQDLSETDLKDDDQHPLIFEAACIFENLRRTATDTKINRGMRCRTRIGTGHDASYMAGLNCAICHSARCFKHILELGIHSSDAVLLHSRDKTRVTWHTRHTKSKDAYGKALDDLHEAGRRGISTNMQLQLVAMAKMYPKCRPLHARVSRGWYDRPELILLLPSKVSGPPTNSVPEKSGLSISISTDNDTGHAGLDSPLSPLTELDDDGEQLADQHVLGETFTSDGITSLLPGTSVKRQALSSSQQPIASPAAEARLSTSKEKAYILLPPVPLEYKHHLVALCEVSPDESDYSSHKQLQVTRIYGTQSSSQIQHESNGTTSRKRDESFKVVQVTTSAEGDMAVVERSSIKKRKRTSFRPRVPDSDDDSAATVSDPIPPSDTDSFDDDISTRAQKKAKLHGAVSSQAEQTTIHVHDTDADQASASAVNALNRKAMHPFSMPSNATLTHNKHHRTGTGSNSNGTHAPTISGTSRGKPPGIHPKDLHAHMKQVKLTDELSAAGPDLPRRRRASSPASRFETAVVLASSSIISTSPPNLANVNKRPRTVRRDIDTESRSISLERQIRDLKKERNLDSLIIKELKRENCEFKEILAKQDAAIRQLQIAMTKQSQINAGRMSRKNDDPAILVPRLVEEALIARGYVATSEHPAQPTPNEHWRDLPTPIHVPVNSDHLPSRETGQVPSTNRSGQVSHGLSLDSTSDYSRNCPADDRSHPSDHGESDFSRTHHDNVVRNAGNSGRGPLDNMPGNSPAHVRNTSASTTSSVNYETHSALSRDVSSDMRRADVSRAPHSGGTEPRERGMTHYGYDANSCYSHPMPLPHAHQRRHTESRNYGAESRASYDHRSSPRHPPSSSNAPQVFHGPSRGTNSRRGGYPNRGYPRGRQHPGRPYERTNR